VNKKEIKEYCNSKGFAVSALVYPSINEEMRLLLDRAMERSKSNNRKTIFNYDL
jgi:hypothetical protein